MAGRVLREREKTWLGCGQDVPVELAEELSLFRCCGFSLKFITPKCSGRRVRGAGLGL